MQESASVIMPARRPPNGRNQSQSKTLNSNIRVVVRIRPKNAHERATESSRSVVCPVDEKILTFDPCEQSSPSFFQGRRMRRRNMMKRKNRDMQFAFDHVFDESCTQEHVYEHTTKSIVDSVLSGYNCSVFAYGATGAGKTFTMLGGPNQPGIMFLTVMELYHKISSAQSEKLCDIAVSYLEIYNETVKDLLVPAGALAIREDPQKGVVVSGLSLHKPKNAKELFSMLEFGNTNRTQHPTDANAQSSRSHAVFQVFVRQRDRTANVSTDVRVAKMSLIDLAGSERATVTTNRGARFREGANINRSLLALGNCINALADSRNKGKHIPYRNSKLTRLLKDSLGGNCKTVMIAAVSPSSLSYEDTLNTLKYANRAKEIKSTLQKNVVSIDLHISRYTQIIDELRVEVAELKSKLQVQPAVPMATNGPDNMSTYVESPQILGFRMELHKIFQERSSIRKELLELESFDRDLTAKIMRKTMLVERLRLIHGTTALGEKTMLKFDRVIGNASARQGRLRKRKVGVEQRMTENESAISRLTSEMNEAGQGGAMPEALQEALRMRHLEIEVKDGRRQAKYLRKFARQQESHTKSSEKLILRLLTIVRSQYFLIKGSGIATPDLSEEFELIQKQVEGEREVMWADQSSVNETGAAATDDAAGDDFNRLLNLPILSCVQITPNAPGHRRASRSPQTHSDCLQATATTPHAQSLPSRRLSYASVCQTTVGITPMATGLALRIPGQESHNSLGHPHRIPTPVSKPQHGPQRVPTPQRGAKSPSGTPQRIPTPVKDNVHQPQRLPTPQNHPPGLNTSEHPNTAVERSCSPEVTTALDNSTVHPRVGSISSPVVREQDIHIDGIAPLQATPPVAPASSTVEQSSIHPSNCELPLADASQAVATAHEYSLGMPVVQSSAAQIAPETLGSEPSIDIIARTISFEEEGSSKLELETKTSPVSATKMTYAQVASSPINVQPTRTPFGEISVNSPVIGRAPSSAKKAPGLNESFTICKGVLQENFKKDVNQRRPNRRDTFSARSRPNVHHHRSRSQGQPLGPGPSANKTQHSDTLKKYGLPSMTDSSTGGSAKPVPAYMSMTKAAANKRRANVENQKQFSQISKENQQPTNTRGRPLFTSGNLRPNTQGNTQGGMKSNLARSFSVGNIRQTSRNLSNNTRNQSAWNF